MPYKSIIVDRIHSPDPIDRAPDGAAPPPDTTQVRTYDSNNVMRVCYRIPDTPPLRYRRATFVKLP
ncbi:hypothetical protein [Cupriavidus alkaliphilus]|uniref:hypothetical protein n=1 Tax=Cupriavidus alkaliphilus TaxID=942866 RepID=UPI00339D7E0B